MAEERIQRRLAAILAADVVGYSRLMEADEAGTLARLKAVRREIVDPMIAEHSGRMVKLMGDGALVEFASAVDAVTCALAIQRSVHERNAGTPERSPILFRVGINVGDIIVEGDDIYGDGVNIAARIEGLAGPGEIYLSRAAADQVRDKIAIRLEERGEHMVKNIARAIEIYRARSDDDDTPTLASGAPPSSSPPTVVDKPSIAVLAFNNMSGDPEQEYFSDGISEDIITDLSKLSDLHVIARNSSFVYKNGAVSIPQVARDLSVRYLLEGSVRKAGNRVRVNAQLIDATDGSHVWADRFDRDLTDIFAVQDELTREIVSALKLNLAEGEAQRQTHEHTDNLEAFDWLLRGRERWWRHTRESNAQAQEMLQRAVELDPDYAAAHAVLSLTHAFDYVNELSATPEQSLKQALVSAERATALDDDYPNAHHAMASAKIWLREHNEAIHEAERAVALNPNFADGYALLGLILNFSGEPESALQHLERNFALDPHHPDIYLHWAAVSYLHLGRYDEAIRLLNRRLIRNPETDISRVLLAACYGHLGRLEEARTAWQEVFRVNPSYSLEHRRRVLPYKNREDFEHFLNGLRKAGVLEES